MDTEEKESTLPKLKLPYDTLDSSTEVKDLVDSSNQTAIVPPDVISLENSKPVPSSGRRETLINLKIILTEDELKQTGVQKLILEEFQRAETKVSELEGFREKYYKADTELKIAEEKLNTNQTFDIMTSVGIGLGGVIFGTFKYLADKELTGLAWLAAILGLATMGLSYFAKLKKSQK